MLLFFVSFFYAEVLAGVFNWQLRPADLIPVPAGIVAYRIFTMSTIIGRPRPTATHASLLRYFATSLLRYFAAKQ
jgi:hypothetical protein